MKQLLLLGLLLAGLGLTGCEFNQLAGDEQVDQPLLVPKLQINGQKAKTASNQSTSPYSCLISTLADDEADYNYWNQAFWVHFPKPAVEQAEGKTIFKAFSFASEHAGDKAGSWAGTDKYCTGSPVHDSRQQARRDFVGRTAQKIWTGYLAGKS